MLRGPLTCGEFCSILRPHIGEEFLTSEREAPRTVPNVKLVPIVITLHL